MINNRLVMLQTGLTLLLLLTSLVTTKAVEDEAATKMIEKVTPQEASSLSTKPKLVPLHRFDNFVECLSGQRDDDVFCVAQAYVKPNNQTQAWIDIMEYSKVVQHHFRYDRLSRGICIKKCVKKLQLIDDTESLLTEKFMIDPWLYRPAPDVDRNITAHREAYEKLVRQCINLELSEYGLEAYSELDFCIESKELNDNVSDDDWDPLELLAVVVISLIGISCALSTLYDLRLYKSNDHHTHFTVAPKGVNTKLLSFSIPRNFGILFDGGKQVKGDYFDYFEGLRVFSMILITIFHTFALITSVSFVNPSGFEATTYTAVSKIVSGGSFTVQIFFTFTGFLLTLPNVKQVNEGKPLTLNDFVVSLKNRLIRLYPVYMFILLIETSLLRYCGTGPIWTQFVGYEEGYCRRSWWQNLLFINNMVDTRNMCLVQSWYISADMQLFVVRFIVLTVISRCPKYKKHIFGLVIFITYLIPTLVTYLNGFQAIMNGVPDVARNFYRGFDHFNLHHIPFYTNCGSYMVGVVTAFLYIEIKNGKLNLQNSMWLKILWYLHTPVLIVLLGSSYVVFTYDFDTPSWGVAIYAAIFKNAWGVLIALTIIGYHYKWSSSMRMYLGSQCSQVLGRLNYSYYVAHLTTMKLILGNTVEPPYYSLGALVISIFSIECVTYLAAFCLFIFIEAPMANLLRTQRRPVMIRETSTNNNNKEEVKNAETIGGSSPKSSPSATTSKSKRLNK